MKLEDRLKQINYINKNALELVSLIFDKYNEQLNENINKRKLLEIRDSIISNLEYLKEDESFINDENADKIYEIYKVAYKTMKLEFLFYKHSILFKYFTSNYHDYWYINKLVENEIEDLRNVINYSFWINLIGNLIEEQDNKKDYMSKYIIICLAFSNYPERLRDEIIDAINKINTRLNRIIKYLEEIYNDYTINNKEKIKTFKKFNHEYEELRKRYKTLKEFEILLNDENNLEEVKKTLEKGDKIRKLVQNLVL